MPDTSLESLEFHPLTFVAEQDGIMVGRPDTESYAVLPQDGAELLRRMTEGMPTSAAADWYQHSFGDPIDMADFVATLDELGFIKHEGETSAVPQQVRFQALGRAFFLPLAWLCYAGVLAAALVFLVRDPAVRPFPHNVFFSPYLVVVQIVLTAVTLPAVLWHEWFHVLAARRLGLPSRLRVSRRFYFAVVETELNGLLSVPPRKRYLPFLAGMIADVVLFSGLTVLAANVSGQLLWIGKLALAIAYLTLLRFAWQFFVFLRTDPYYAICTALGCTNLYEASQAYLRKRLGWLPLPGLKPAASDAETEFSPRDAALAPAFATLTVIGLIFLSALLAFAVVPVMYGFVTRLVHGLATGSIGGTRFWDSTVSLLIVLLEVAVLPYLAGRAKRRNERAASEVAA